MRRAFSMLGLAAILLVAWLSVLPAPASASVTGPCTASIDGVDVTSGHDEPSTAVPLQSGEQIPVAGTAQGRVLDLSYTVKVVGGGIQVGSVVVDGRSWTGTLDLEDFSRVSVGLFEVTVDAQTAAGDCTGVAYVCIEGRSPLTTAVGAGATALGVGGFILLLLSLTRAGRMTGMRAGTQGFAGGTTAGIGGAVLLQQFCVMPLTAATAFGVPVAIGVAGAVGASLLRRAGTGAGRRAAQHLGGGPADQLPAGPDQDVQVARDLESASDQGAAKGFAEAGQGAGGGAPGATPAGGPSPAPGATPAGGPSPAPGATPAGGPSPAPGAAPAGGPSPAPGAVPLPTEGGVIVPPLIPPAPDDRVRCPECGNENTRDSRFCTNCGARLEG
ncbi:MAG TPA: zinc ribbon domain-containing protein [Actinomycetota bacterium]|nr:zinc ribbon domain-containing protein [Actinomycetota bacterium]